MAVAPEVETYTTAVAPEVNETAAPEVNDAGEYHGGDQEGEKRTWCDRID